MTKAILAGARKGRPKADVFQRVKFQCWDLEMHRQGLHAGHPDTSGKILIPIGEDRIMPGSIVYSDYWCGYNAAGLILISNTKGFIIKSCLPTSVITSIHVNGIHINGTENFRTKPKSTCESLTVFLQSISRYF